MLFLVTSSTATIWLLLQPASIIIEVALYSSLTQINYFSLKYYIDGSHWGYAYRATPALHCHMVCHHTKLVRWNFLQRFYRAAIDQATAAQ